MLTSPSSFLKKPTCLRSNEDNIRVSRQLFNFKPLSLVHPLPNVDAYVTTTQGKTPILRSSYASLCAGFDGYGVSIRGIRSINQTTVCLVITRQNTHLLCWLPLVIANI